jgi:hypothetical protein
MARMNGGYDGTCNRIASPGSLKAMTEEKLACTRSPTASVSVGSVCQLVPPVSSAADCLGAGSVPEIALCDRIDPNVCVYQYGDGDHAPSAQRV